MADRMTLIAQLGAAIASADDALRPVLVGALSALVEDHGIIAAHEKRKAADRSRKRSGHSVESADSVESAEVRTGSPAPQVSLLSPTPPNNPSFPPPPPTTPPAATDPSPPRAIRVVPAGLGRPEVERVLAYYVGLHPRRKPGPADRKAVEKGLAMGYSADELCEAISGNASDEWHREKRKHDLGYVLRSNGQIDNFRAKATPTHPEIRDGWFVEAG